ncbi:organic cation transporter protein isoform X1 [Aethina tumida]|uniref:organic cation transporter protein isoform X1 n=1 Tax=Aethina tumida TaxID=116153 RepID=UPI00096AEC1F|nr:organic cation transporter protein isoform X1 [Aethina tumida]
MTQTVDNSLDNILVQLGDFGKYQKLIFVLICFAVTLHSAVHVAFVFTALQVDYRCEVPGCDSADSQYYTPWLKDAVPFSDGKPEKCDMYASYSDNSNCSVFNTDKTLRCSSFIYKTEEKSILQEYDLHCDNNLWKLTFVGTMNNIGQFFGLFISGIMSDRYGRKQVLIWGMVACAICGIIRAFMPTYELFLVFEFLDAAFAAGTYICGFVLGVELVGPKNRVLTGVVSSSCYAVGEVFAAGSAWLLQSWKPIIFTLYSPIFLLLTYIWLVPESVRWLLSKGRIDEAKEILRKVAKTNGKEISENSLDKLSMMAQEESQRVEHPFKEALKSTPLMLRLINCCFCWITCTFLFYGLTLNSVALAGNSYLDFILTSLVEIPAYVSCNFMVDKWGRRKTLCWSYILTGAGCAAFIFIPEDLEWGSLVVYLLGKFGATAAFTILYVLTSEMFPTNMRHSFMGTCSTFGRIGSMVSPQTPLLSQIWTPLPLVCFASMSVIAGILTMLFPETLNTKLPDTIEEAINIGKNKNTDKENAIH